MCQKNSSDPNLYQVTDLTWSLKAKFYFSIMKNMTTYFDFKDFSLGVIGYYNNTESISLFTFKSIILPIANDIIKGKINKPFKDGPIPLGDTLRNLGLGILDLKYLQVWAEYQYLVF